MIKVVRLTLQWGMYCREEYPHISLTGLLLVYSKNKYNIRDFPNIVSFLSLYEGC